MKLIKKIAAIMFAFMMVFSLSTNVKAESGKYEDSNGKITISKAIEKQTYTIYRMLKLESFDGTNYSYKLEDGWDNFITGGGKDYLEKNNDGYITFIKGKDNPEDMRLFAKAALAYAKVANNHITNSGQKAADSTKVVEFTGLKLGYYLVDSSVGALCSLTTTKPLASLEEKNGAPELMKYVYNTNHDGFFPYNDASLGTDVKFKTEIKAKPGVENYILHDKMESGLTFNNDLKVNVDGTAIPEDKMTITYVNNNADKCAFEIKFDDNYLNSLFSDTKKELNITVEYTAKLNKNAVSENHNKAELIYGDNNKIESETKTCTYTIPVFKYTGTNTPLEGAVFTLSKDKEGFYLYKLVFVESKDDYAVYRLKTDEDSEPSSVANITTGTTGKFKITGLGSGVYYLKETKAPNGYNVLKDSKKIVIAENGGMKLDADFNNGVVTGGEFVKGDIQVKNNAGIELPSTGGMGTTLIYLIGGALVLGSGIVLANKKRAKAK